MKYDYNKIEMDLLSARRSGLEAVENTEDNGASNFDVCEIYLKGANKRSIYQFDVFLDKEPEGWWSIRETVGQGRKQTLFVETMRDKLLELGYTARVRYILD